MDARGFTVGLVLRRGFGLVSRHFGAFAIAAGITTFLPQLLIVFTTESASAGGVDDAGRYAPYVGLCSLLALVLLLPVLNGIVIRAALGDARGEQGDLGRDIAAALRSLLPNLVIAGLYYAAVVLGLALLIVPGIILQCAWFVVTPAYMAEGIGVFRAFGRSSALTKGHRWSLFGVWILYWIAFSISNSADDLAHGPGIGAGAHWGFHVVEAALNATLFVVGAAIAAAAYVELNRIHGNPLAADLAEAFT